MNFVILSLSLLLFPFSAFAILPGPVADPVKSGIGTLDATIKGTDDYRLGDEWGKRAVTAAGLETARPAFRRGALATARTGGATGFYLGKFNGQHVMATNHHVYSYASACVGRGISFPMLGISVICEKFLGTFPEIDLALFTVKVANESDATRLEEVGANFQFREDLRPGQNLLTIGFGVAGNGNRQLMANEDSDCYVFSQEGEYRLMADPDEWNPGPYRAWSFANGCDVSHGDSGSAMLDRESGRVMGIIWTGRIPKSTAVQNSNSLNDFFRSRNETIWTELSYAVPARKIGEFLEALLKTNLPEDTKSTIQALLR